MSEELKPLNLWQKLVRIMQKVEYIRKDRTVENYKAVSHDAVTAEVRPWFAELGVLVFSALETSQMVESGKTAKGTIMNRMETVWNVTFVNADNPTERETVRVPAHAIDHGDKAPGKTMSYAVKYAILKVLMIETGENDEGRSTSNMTPDDEAMLREAICKIKNSTTKEELLQTYNAAYSAYKSDKESLRQIIDAKDARKKVIECA